MAVEKAAHIWVFFRSAPMPSSVMVYTFRLRAPSWCIHLPVMIYPSPLATDRYVVLNSGHTFRGVDFAGTNALLYPRLGDHAILKLSDDKKDPLKSEVQVAGIFDDSWRLVGGP